MLPSGEDLAWLAKTNMWWAYSAIFGVQDLLPYPDLSDLAEGGFSVEEAHEARRRSEQRQEENASRRVRALRGRAHILATAKNEKDFELRLDTMIHDEEPVPPDSAEDGLSGLALVSDTINAILWPGEMVLRTAQWAVANSPQYVAGPGGTVVMAEREEHDHAGGAADD